MRGGMVGGEQHGLAVVGGPLEDRVDVLGEAHVEHLVGLVEDDHPQRREVSDPRTGGPTPVRRGHDDVDALFQGTQLPAHRLPAVDGQDPDTETTAVTAHRLAHLRGEFPGGHEHHGARGCPALGTRTALAPFPVADAMQHGQRERGGLPRAGGGLSDDVAAVEQRWNRRPLDGRGFLVTELGQRLEQLRAQSQLTETGESVDEVLRFRRDGDHE